MILYSNPKPGLGSSCKAFRILSFVRWLLVCVCVQLLKGVMQKLLDIWALLEHLALVLFLLGICLKNRPSGTQQICLFLLRNHHLRAGINN